MRLTHIILLFIFLNLTACTTANRNNADAALDQRELKTQNLDQQNAASTAASTISPLTY